MYVFTCSSVVLSNFHTFDVVGTLFVVENEYEKNF